MNIYLNILIILLRNRQNDKGTKASRIVGRLQAEALTE